MEIREPLIPGKTYHVCTRSNGTDDIFRESHDYEYFIKAFKKRLSDDWEIIAWVLIPNEIHFAIRIKETEHAELISHSNLIGHLLNGYVQHYNDRYMRQGSLFNRSFRRKSITSESELKDLICLIDNLPVARELADDQGDWQHGSFHEFQESNYFTEAAQVVRKKFRDIVYYIHHHLRPHLMRANILPKRKWLGARASLDPLGMKHYLPP